MKKGSAKYKRLIKHLRDNGIKDPYRMAAGLILKWAKPKRKKRKKRK